MCERYRVMPDDPLITEMDPVHRLFLFYHWQDKEITHIKNMENQSIMIGMFSNPEMAKSIIEKRDGNTTGEFESTDDGFQESLNMIKELDEPIKINKKIKIKS